MSIEISTLIEALGGKTLVRPNLYRVEFAWPLGLRNVAARYTDQSVISLLITATALPEASLEKMSLTLYGWELKFPSDNKLPTWTITVLNDANFRYYDLMNNWMDEINSSIKNTGSDKNINELSADVSISLMSRDTTKTNTAINDRDLYIRKLYSVYPISIGSVPLAASDTGASTFEVTFEINGGVDRVNRK